MGVAETKGTDPESGSGCTGWWPLNRTAPARRRRATGTGTTTLCLGRARSTVGARRRCSRGGRHGAAAAGTGTVLAPRKWPTPGPERKTVFGRRARGTEQENDDEGVALVLGIGVVSCVCVCVVGRRARGGRREDFVWSVLVSWRLLGVGKQLGRANMFFIAMPRGPFSRLNLRFRLK